MTVQSRPGRGGTVGLAVTPGRGHGECRGRLGFESRRLTGKRVSFKLIWKNPLTDNTKAAQAPSQAYHDPGSSSSYTTATE